MSCDACTKVVGAIVAIVPSEICVEIIRGNYTPFEFHILDESGDPVNISADAVRLRIWDEPGGTLKIEKENGPGEHLDPTNGRTKIYIEADDISDPQGSDRLYWVYEVRRLIGESETETKVHISGQFIVEPAPGGSP
ncbi:MAG: hypothetical protein GWM98_04620 [Nitrospinaceae bacterium]|nr:hypothetical protein [Deltaproteobacteria bacterium]NIY14203.1 hypothetical protein [Nitrospinaceae bacterium]